MLRIGPDGEQPWPTDDETREILRNDPRPSGTVYWSHFAIRFTRKQMVLTPVLLADALADAAQAELWAHNPFASRSTITSTATLPTQGQMGPLRMGISLVWRVAYSGLRDSQSGGGRAGQLNDWHCRVADGRNIKGDAQWCAACWSRSPICANATAFRLNPHYSPTLAALTFIEKQLTTFNFSNFLWFPINLENNCLSTLIFHILKWVLTLMRLAMPQQCFHIHVVIPSTT